MVEPWTTDDISEKICISNNFCLGLKVAVILIKSCLFAHFLLTRHSNKYYTFYMPHTSNIFKKFIDHQLYQFNLIENKELAIIIFIQKYILFFSMSLFSSNRCLFVFFCLFCYHCKISLEQQICFIFFIILFCCWANCSAIGLALILLWFMCICI